MTQLSSWIIQKGPQTSKLLFESLNLFTVLLTYRSNKTIRLHMKRNGDDKNQHPSGLMVISVPRLIKKTVSSFSFRSRMRQARLDTRMTDTTGQWISSGGRGNDYNSTCTETWTLQQTEKSKRNVKSKKRTVHPSLLVAKPFVNETKALARNSLGS